MADGSAIKPLASQVAELLTSISGFAWPAIVFLGLYLLRDRLTEIITIAIKRLEQATDIEIGSLKLKGATITQTGEVLKSENEDFELISATASDVAGRHDRYKNQRNLMLVHTIKPSDPPEFIEGYRVFDVSVFLHPHRNFGKLNDVRRVTYFFGEKWGKGKHGSKFVVSSGNDQFAMSAKMYGTFLCVATITFQDGTEVKVDRYLDVEMAPVFGISPNSAR